MNYLLFCRSDATIHGLLDGSRCRSAQIRGVAASDGVGDEVREGLWRAGVAEALAGTRDRKRDV